MAILNQSSLLKSDYKLMYLKLCEVPSSGYFFFIMPITVVGDLVSKYSFTISAAFCFDVAILNKKNKTLYDIMNDVFPYFSCIRNLWHFSFQ